MRGPRADDTGRPPTPHTPAKRREGPRQRGTQLGLQSAWQLVGSAGFVQRSAHDTCVTSAMQPPKDAPSAAAQLALFTSDVQGPSAWSRAMRQLAKGAVAPPLVQAAARLQKASR